MGRIKQSVIKSGRSKVVHAAYEFGQQVIPLCGSHLTAERQGPDLKISCRRCLRTHSYSRWMIRRGDNLQPEVAHV